MRLPIGRPPLEIPLAERGPVLKSRINLRGGNSFARRPNFGGGGQGSRGFKRNFSPEVERRKGALQSCHCQLHSSLNGGSLEQGGIDRLMAPAPPLDADTPLDAAPLLDVDTLRDP